MTEQKYYYKSTTKKEFNCVKDDEKLIETLSDKGYTVYSVRQKTNQLIPYHEHPTEEMVIESPVVSESASHCSVYPVAVFLMEENRPVMFTVLEGVSVLRWATFSSFAAV